MKLKQPSIQQWLSYFQHNFLVNDEIMGFALNIIFHSSKFQYCNEMLIRILHIFLDKNINFFMESPYNRFWKLSNMVHKGESKVVQYFTRGTCTFPDVMKMTNYISLWNAPARLILSIFYMPDFCLYGSELRFGMQFLANLSLPNHQNSYNLSEISSMTVLWLATLSHLSQRKPQFLPWWNSPIQS